MNWTEAGKLLACQPEIGCPMFEQFGCRGFQVTPVASAIFALVCVEEASVNPKDPLPAIAAETSSARAQETDEIK
ncbi:hypothetical protein NDA01_00230 [Trichocoleus desertorum AS-A10]|uniref:hypothetical protein n=1 Tax=Trichocoleus desertorum TaxID=1481672 RepID=UPI00329A4639